MKLHPSITLRRIESLARAQMFGLENPGLCLVCGHEQDGCEPDARRYECEACGERKVFGAQEILLMVGV